MAPPLKTYREAKLQFERDYAERALAAAGWNVTRAARLAGKGRPDFYALLARTGVDPERARARAQRARRRDRKG